jgi:poly(3-hydroxybutyrate) depolymerase
MAGAEFEGAFADARRAARASSLLEWNAATGTLRLIATALLALILGTGSSASDTPERLPTLCIDPEAVSVSGVSSGAAFAHQFHVAHSTRVMGAGIFAGGPYLCAGENFPQNLFRSLNVCSNTGRGPFLGPPNPQRSISAARIAARAGGIDDTSGLRGDRVFLFSGRLDTFVPKSVVAAVQDFYRAFDNAKDIAFVSDVDAAHAMVTENFGNACDTSESPHLNDCDYDLAGATLAQIYGSLQPATTASGELLAFTQTEFVKAGERHGLAPTGYAYVPEACARSAGCRLHVAFHGCLQNTDTIGDAFIRHAGYNEWAEANRITVLYPQAAAVTSQVAGIEVDWPNPMGCWDWWGFTGKDFARKNGRQISAINAMIDRLAGRGGGVGSPSPSTPSCDQEGRR